MARLGKKKNEEINWDDAQSTEDVFDRVFADIDRRRQIEIDAAVKEVQREEEAKRQVAAINTQPPVPSVQATASLPVKSDTSEKLKPVQIAHKGVIFGASSVIGKREYQQDSFATSDNGKDAYIAVVCDGMGGMNGGEQASALCVEKLLRAFDSGVDNVPEFFRRNVVDIDNAVASLKNEDGSLMGGGSTLVSVIFIGNELYWCSVGDSHIYIVRGDEMVLVNTEHNYMMELLKKVKKGEMTLEQAKGHPDKDALTSYMGIGIVTLMDIIERPFKLEQNDHVILCSDGLYRALSDKEIFNTVKSSRGDVLAAAQNLTNLATAKNLPFQDNTTVIVAKFN